MITRCISSAATAALRIAISETAMAKMRLFWVPTFLAMAFTLALVGMLSSSGVEGAVLIPGAKAPSLITEDDLKLMRPGTVIVDVAVDQVNFFQFADRDARKRPELQPQAFDQGHRYLEWIHLV